MDSDSFVILMEALTKQISHLRTENYKLAGQLEYFMQRNDELLKQNQHLQALCDRVMQDADNEESLNGE